MKKGISPIVAVVLLIAISVIAAVGLYFWVGGLATKQPTPTTPRTIVAYAVVCNTANSSLGNPASVKNATILISNTSPPGTTAIAAGALSVSTSGAGWSCPANSLSPGSQESCVLANDGTGKGFGSGDGTLSIFGDSIASATVTC